MKSRYRAEMILILTTLIAGAGWVFSKQSIVELPPLGFIGSRFLLAALILLPFCRKELKALGWAHILRAMMVGCFMASALFCWIFAVSVSDTLGEGAFIMSLSMLIVPLVAWVMTGTAPPRSFWLALPMALVGLLLISSATGWQFDLSQLWFLMAAIGFSIHFNLNRIYVAKISPILLTSLQLLTTGSLGLLLSYHLETWPETVSHNTWAWFTCSVIIATSLRYLLQTTGQKLVESTNAALIMLLEPIWTLLLSILVYGETLPVSKMIGCAILLSALIFFRFSTMSKAAR
ncbi:DMT family transporter [Vibrio hippocampi]|uniref:EamA domain-containing protein n=1 Tax=Vibrio hippocampi TaxID=654686 RepID=A0ABN8DG76_9VIBR|nr:DMT family transporter [Vibrio hippocampi]CAH0526137.1 hypothetical protein VHP8226_01611 [Vibrio hippocampi]